MPIIRSPVAMCDQCGTKTPLTDNIVRQWFFLTHMETVTLASERAYTVTDYAKVFCSRVCIHAWSNPISELRSTRTQRTVRDGD